jgi:multiple sugar transport system substrate-binding protein
MPKTLDELVSHARKITAVGSGQQYGVAVPGLSAPMVRMIIPIADVSGVQPYDYRNGKFDFTGYAPILKAFKQMFSDGSFLPGSASMKVDPTRVQFSEGNVGFYGNASQEVGVLTTQFPAKMEWGAAEMPSVDGKIKGALTCTPNNGWLITSQCKYPDKAWEVVKFLSSVELNKGYVEAGLNLSISPFVMQQVDLTKLGKLAEFKPVPYEGVYPAVPNVTPQGKVWQDALWETVLSGGPDIAATITKLNKTYNDALDREVSMGKARRLVISDFDPLRPSAGKLTYKDK